MLKKLKGGLLGLNLIAQRGVASAVQIVAIPLLISALGKEGYGAFVVLGSLWAWSGLTEFGIGTALQVEISHRRVNQQSYRCVITAVALLSITLPILLAPIVMLFGHFLGPYFLGPFQSLTLGEKRWLTTLAVMLSICTVYSNLVYRVWLAEFRGQLYSLALSLGPLGGLGAVWAAHRWVADHRFSWIIVAYWAPAVVIGVAASIFQLSRSLELHFATLRESLKAITRQTPRYFAINFGYYAVNQVDLLIMSQIGTVDDLVQYAIAQKLMGGIYLAYNAILMAYGPHCSEAMFNRLWKRVNRIMARQICIGFSAAFFATGVFYWFGADIVALLTRRTAQNVSEAVWAAGLTMVTAKMWSDTFGGVLSNARITAPVLLCLPIQAVVSASCQYVFGTRFGCAGIFAGMALGQLLTSGWMLPRALWQYQRSHVKTEGVH